MNDAPLTDLVEAIASRGASLAASGQRLQLVAIAVSLALSWIVVAVLRHRFGVSDGLPARVAGGLRRVSWPLLAAALMVAARHFLFPRQAHLIQIALELVLSMAAVRLAVYMLRQVMPANGILLMLEKAVAWLVWGWVALHITGVLEPITAFLDQLGFSVGRQRLSVLLALQGLLVVAVTLVVTLWLGRVLEQRLMQLSAVDPSLRVVLSKVLRAFLIVAAVLIALPAVGIDVTVLSVFGGAFGVGLGIGLQKIASNYVSGFIILLDRAIRPGDILTVGDRYGVVTSLKARYTVLRALDGTEVIIPNETFVTNVVVNHSYSDKRVMVRLEMQVAYDSPLEEALAIMAEAARAHPRILDEPGPVSMVKAFGDSGITLELAAWIPDPEVGQGQMRSELYLDIWKRFKAQGIAVPSPQRDVRVTLTNREGPGGGPAVGPGSAPAGGAPPAPEPR